MVVARSQSIVEEYEAKHQRSKALAQEAAAIFPSSVTHDARHATPFPLYVTHAEGAHKWDVDGNRYVDFWMGHGALLLGHNRAEVEAAVAEQLPRGTHYGACQELEIAWGRKVIELVPCAERVKFTSSGTEATMMAMRLARAHTGRKKIAKFQGHFHGWHDYATAGVRPPFDTPTSAGVPAETLSTVVVLPPNDIDAVRAALASREVAAVILEPGGASNASVPTRPGFLQALREATRETDTLLIFDEVVTGFRYAPGGAQQRYGVTPDLCSLAKILAGGLPGGAVAGRTDVLGRLEFRDDPHWNRFERVAHPGTYNANPVSAAAGVACLGIVGTGEPHRIADGLAERMRREMNDVLRTYNIEGVVYGEASHFHILIAPGFQPGDGSNTHLSYLPAEQIMGAKGKAGGRLVLALRNEGVDCSGGSGSVSSAHTDADIAETIAAFDRAVAQLQREGLT